MRELITTLCHGREIELLLKPFCRQVKRHGFMLQNVMQAENILQSASKAFIQTELRQENLL